MHFLLRLRPPGALRGYQPEHLLVGHGRGVHGPDAAAALEDAYARSRRDLPGFAKRLPGDRQGRDQEPLTSRRRAGAAPVRAIPRSSVPTAQAPPRRPT